MLHFFLWQTQVTSFRGAFFAPHGVSSDGCASFGPTSFFCCAVAYINMTRVVSKACETFMKHLEISRTVAHCTLKVQALLQYPKAQPSRCSTWRWFSAWLGVSQCSKHRISILGAERSASAHDTAPSWNSSMVTTYWEGKCTWPDGANSFGIF